MPFVVTLMQYNFCHIIRRRKLYVTVLLCNVRLLENWKDKEEIIKNSTIVVVGRKDNPLLGFERSGTYANPWYCWWNDYKDKIVFLDIQNIDVSSSLIRNNIKECRQWKYLTTEKVANYIEQFNLYKE